MSSAAAWELGTGHWALGTWDLEWAKEERGNVVGTTIGSLVAWWPGSLLFFLSPVARFARLARRARRVRLAPAVGPYPVLGRGVKTDRGGK